MSDTYFITYKKEKKNTAGSKAPDDIARLCREAGYQERVMAAFPENQGKLYKKLWLLTVGILQWERVYRTIPEGAVVFYQHPSYGYRIILRYLKKLRQKKHCRFVALVHDLESLRGGIKGVIDSRENTYRVGDTVLLKEFDAVICHNARMKEYLVGQGLDPARLVELQIFDYLSDCDYPDGAGCARESVAIAGNLAPGKSGYIYDIGAEGRNAGLEVHLYGINYQPEKAGPGMIYHGSFHPDELPGKLTGRYGLVWDGDTASTCGGNTGEYLKYNNPHKTSLYLSCRMPVVVWKQAAIARFVEENGVGVAVDSLYDLEAALRKVSDADYEAMRANTRQIADRLRSGYYFKTAFEKALKIAADRA